MAFFSIAHCINPLIGLYAGLSASIFALLIKIGFTWYSTSLTSLPILVYHIPTFCGSLYLSNLAHSSPTFAKRLLAAFIPALCMILFSIHPVGSGAFAYTFFWLIPLGTALIPHNNLFLHALGSTFSSHAVGSVLWIYLINSLSVATWYGLIPVVIAERLFFASGMTLIVLAARKMKAVAPKALRVTTWLSTTQPN
jgi:hypothetical protein